MDERQRLLLRRFRSLYFKAAKCFEGLRPDDGPLLKLAFQSGALTVAGPGESDELTRFIVIMRAFLSQREDTNFRTVWSVSQSLDLSAQRAASASDEVEALMARLERGVMGVTINNQAYDARTTYDLVSEGGYFSSDAAMVKKLHELEAMPIVDPLLKFQFVDYAFLGFALMQTLFGILSESGAFRERHGPTAHPGPCVYCLEQTGGFTSEEHIFPESLGNTELILDPGLVCDRCNNGPLALLDKALLRFPPIAFMQVIHVPITKQLKLPSANFQNMTFEKTAPRRLRVTPKDRTGQLREIERFDDGTVRFQLEVRSGKFDPRLLARALMKIGIGLLVLEEGADVARSERYEPARRFVLNGEGFANNLLFATRGTPDPAVRAARHPTDVGTAYAFSIFGVMLAFNLEPLPRLELTEELAAVGFAIHPLDQPTGS